MGHSSCMILKIKQRSLLNIICFITGHEMLVFLAATCSRIAHLDLCIAYWMKCEHCLNGWAPVWYPASGGLYSDRGGLRDSSGSSLSVFPWVQLESRLGLMCSCIFVSTAVTNAQRGWGYCSGAEDGWLIGRNICSPHCRTPVANRPSSLFHLFQV